MAQQIIMALTLVVFPALMAYSASSDLFTMTIPNRICLALVVGYFGLALAAGLPASAVAINFSCAFGVLALTFFLFSMGWIGGGDAKLAAATALWLGWTELLDYGVLTSALGGVLTMAIVVSRKIQLPQWAARLDWVARLHSAASGSPDGVALAAAGLALYPHSQLWQLVAGR
jgi:prepilin peptidase CpaA